MGLTERHWFENEDVPENYEWVLEDAVYNFYANKKHNDDIVRCKDCKYVENYTDIYDDRGYKCLKHNFHQEYHNADWYCADGER